MRIVSREHAILRGSRRYFTGRACRNGHVSERYVSSRRCIECISYGKFLAQGARARTPKPQPVVPVMVARVVIHPSVRLSDLSELVRDNLLVLKYRLAPAGPGPAPVRRLICTCLSCAWYGPEPAYTDSRDAFNPPRGDIPRCPRCGSWEMQFTLKRI